jgi:hypothetical protein
MDEGQPGAAGETVAEVVGRFADREHFAAAVKGLLAAGFEEGDLSVLDSHQPLPTSENPEEVRRSRFAGLTEEIVYVGPITAAGLIMVASGPVGALAAGAIGAGLAGAAVHDLLSELDATSRTREFAKALESGAVLLWVRADAPDRRRAAADIIGRHGGGDVHVHHRRVRRD